MNKTSRQVLEAAAQLRDAVDELKFKAPVTHVYNPLRYAWASHELYVKKFAAAPKRILFFGMNPGPFGMMQTGVPFGEVAAVRDWMDIHAEVQRPAGEHPERPVLGFDCPRTEVSGQRLWGLFAKRFGRAPDFFRDHYVVNYCPLAFLKAPVRNHTPDKLPWREQEQLFALCDSHLRSVVDALLPDWLVGIGNFAFERLEAALAPTSSVRLVRILHPSPACPASNNDWAGKVTRQLQECGAWPRA